MPIRLLDGYSSNAVALDAGCKYVHLVLKDWIVLSIRFPDESLVCSR